MQYCDMRKIYNFIDFARLRYLSPLTPVTGVRNPLRGANTFFDNRFGDRLN